MDSSFSPSNSEEEFSLSSDPIGLEDADEEFRPENERARSSSSASKKFVISTRRSSRLEKEKKASPEATRRSSRRGGAEGKKRGSANTKKSAAPVRDGKWDNSDSDFSGEDFGRLVVFDSEAPRFGAEEYDSEDFLIKQRPDNLKKKEKKKEDTARKPNIPHLIKKYHALPTDKEGKIILPIELRGLVIDNLGTIVSDRPKFHSRRYIWPVGYKSHKVYHSTKELDKKSTYTNEILDGGREPIFRVSCPEDGFLVTKPTSSGAWAEVAKRYFELKRGKSGKSTYTQISGPEMYGYGDPTIAKVIQEMPGAENCHEYEMQVFIPHGKVNLHSTGERRDFKPVKKPEVEEDAVTKRKKIKKEIDVEDDHLRSDDNFHADPESDQTAQPLQSFSSAFPATPATQSQPLAHYKQRPVPSPLKQNIQPIVQPNNNSIPISQSNFASSHHPISTATSTQSQSTIFSQAQNMSSNNASISSVSHSNNLSSTPSNNLASNNSNTFSSNNSNNFSSNNSSNNSNNFASTNSSNNSNNFASTNSSNNSNNFASTNSSNNSNNFASTNSNNPSSTNSNNPLSTNSSANSFSQSSPKIGALPSISMLLNNTTPESQISPAKRANQVENFLNPKPKVEPPRSSFTQTVLNFPSKPAQKTALPPPEDEDEEEVVESGFQ